MYNIYLIQPFMKILGYKNQPGRALQGFQNISILFHHYLKQPRFSFIIDLKKPQPHYLSSFLVFGMTLEILRDLDPLQAHDKFPFSHTCHISFQMPQSCFVGKHSKTQQFDIKINIYFAHDVQVFLVIVLITILILAGLCQLLGCASLLALHGWANLRQMAQFCSSVSFSIRQGWMCSHDTG